MSSQQGWILAGPKDEVRKGAVQIDGQDAAGRADCLPDRWRQTKRPRMHSTSGVCVECKDITVTQAGWLSWELGNVGL